MRRLNINKNFLFSAGKTFQVALDYMKRAPPGYQSGYFDIWKFFYRKNSGKQTG